MIGAKENQSAHGPISNRLVRRTHQLSSTGTDPGARHGENCQKSCFEPHSACVLTVRRSAEQSVGLPPVAPFGRMAGSNGSGSLAAGFTTMQPCSLHWPKAGGCVPAVPFHMYLWVQHGTNCPELPSQEDAPIPQPFENQKHA